MIKINPFKSKNKQYVRDKQWKTCFEETNNKLQRYENSKRELRYLCFPAEECIFINQLFKNKLINKKTFIVGVEEDSALAYEIRLKFRSWFEEESFKIFPDWFEDLVIDEEFAIFFPFDIANLDFTKCVLNIDSVAGDLPTIDSIQNFFINQSHSIVHRRVRITDFYLLITSNISIQVPPEIFKRYHGDRNLILIEKVINVFNRFLKNPDLDVILKQKKFTPRGKKRIFILSLCLIVIELGFKYFYIELIEPPIFYKGKKDGAKMVSLKFYCKKQTTIKISSTTTTHNSKMRSLRNVIKLSKQTEFRPEPLT